MRAPGSVPPLGAALIRGVGPLHGQRAIWEPFLGARMQLEEGNPFTYLSVFGAGEGGMMLWGYESLTCPAGPAEGALTQRSRGLTCAVPGTQVQVLLHQKTAVGPEFAYSS